jgi:hypothetical protein
MQTLKRPGFVYVTRALRSAACIAAGTLAIGFGALAADTARAQSCPIQGQTISLDSPAPPTRYGPSACFDPERRGLVLFGGIGSTTDFGDTWLLEGSTWTQESSPVSPSPRHDAPIVYVPSMHACFMFGGVDTNLNNMADGWAWDGTSWTNVSFAGPSPSGRSAGILVYDSSRNKVVLIGGIRSLSAQQPQLLQEVWEFDPPTSSWALRGNNEPPVSNSVAAFDPVRQRIVMVGGEPYVGQIPTLLQVWEYEPVAGTWAPGVQGPDWRGEAGFCWDTALGALVLHGGIDAFYAGLLDFWTFSGSAWNQHVTVSAFNGGEEYLFDDPAYSRVLACMPRATNTDDQTHIRSAGYYGTNLPGIVTQPVDTTVCAGNLAELFVTTDTSLGPYTFQWYKGDQPMPGRTSFGMTLVSPTGSDTGSYFCAITNSCGTVYTRTAMLTVGTGPVITHQPTERAVCAGDSLIFVTAATSPLPITFQWRKNGQNIPGTNQNFYYIAQAAPSDVGYYDCLVSDSCASVPTNVVRLSVGAVVWRSPLDLSVTPCSTATFTVNAAGAAPLSYQWRRNGVSLSDGNNISGAATDTLAIDPARYSDEGSYDVVVTSSCGAAQSDAATLSMNVSRAWTQRNIPGPPARRGPGMVYDRARARTVLFGGAQGGSGTWYGDTWEYDGASWSQVATTGPSPRVNPAMTYDEGRHVSVVFGGYTQTGCCSGHINGDTWEWSGAAWTQRTLAVSPPANQGGKMIYDAATGVCVMYGPGANQWEFNGATGVWTQVTAGGPDPSAGFAFVYDRARARRLLYIGHAGINHEIVYRWDAPTSTFVLISDSAGMGPVYGSSLVFHDTKQQAISMLGFGYGFGYETSMWGLGSTWQDIVDPVPMHTRSDAGLVFDSVRDTLVMYGGWDNNFFVGDDTWEYGGPPGPSVTQQPSALTVISGGPATFTTAAQGTGTLTYQWTVGGQALTESARVTGTRTPTLHISPVSVSDAGPYRCALTVACSTTLTNAAQLTVTPICGSADFNCDGDTATDADIEAFFACLAGTCPPPPCTSTADFNGDGDSATDADIEAFFRVLAGGTC